VTELSLLIRPEGSADAGAIERLHARTFGPGRYARTAFRLREGATARPDLSFTALVGTLIVGSVRVTGARAGGAPAVVLGPLTVDPAFEGRGIGAALMRAAIEAARAAGDGLMLLVGDAPYYARFGFVRVPSGTLALPGPVDPARFLALELAEGALAGARGTVIGR
jgi:predicted N-acetyltransferase YhbS